MSATSPTLSSDQQTYGAVKLSPTSLAPIADALSLMETDKVLLEDFYTCLDGLEKFKMYQCILFVYGFMEDRSWGKIVSQEDENGKFFDVFECLPSPTAQDRISLVRSMVTTDRSCRKRLLQVATSDADKNLIEDRHSAAYFKNYLRCLLRFFSKEGSFGFRKDMTAVSFSLCLQSWENCYLIAACELVDLHLQMSLTDPSTGKQERLDKSQVARRTMSPDDLFKYVVCDKGSSSLEILLKILGATEDERDDLTLTFISSRHKVARIAPTIDVIFPSYLKCYGPGLLSFEVHKNFKTPKTYGNPVIPCFDGAIDSFPAQYMELRDLVADEENKIQQHLPQWETSGTDSTPLEENGRVDVPRYSVADKADTLPSRQDSEVSSASETTSSPEIPFGDKEEGTIAPGPSLLASIAEGVQSLFGLGKQDYGEGLRGLVSTWCTSALHRDASAQASTNVRHAVVLLGGINKDGKQWFLLQNSWKDMPLVLVSAKYLAACSVNAVFIREPLSELPAKYERTTNRYTECASPGSTCKDLFGAAPVRVSRVGNKKDDGFYCGP